MGFYVLAQPEEGAAAALVEHTPGYPSLIAEIGDSQIAVQIPGRADGARLAARFAWEFAKAATEFAARCEELCRPAPGGSLVLGPDGLPASEPGRHAEYSG